MDDCACAASSHESDMPHRIGPPRGQRVVFLRPAALGARFTCGLGRVLEVDLGAADFCAGLACCDTERRLPSGSLNQATLAPPGAFQTPFSSCSRKEYRSTAAPFAVSAF